MSGPGGTVRRERWYRAVWRWHFYAGLFCVPFILWLSVTGGLYLFRPQIEDALYAPYRGIVAADAARLAPSAIAAAASAAVPGAILHKYVLPESPRDAVQVLVGKGREDWRVWVDPVSGRVLYKVPEERRFERVVFHLHGELLAGGFGSALVETAACWTIVMLLTGLFLWWPRQTGGRLAGVLWSRLSQGRGAFWRDVHAVTGLWVTLAALFLISSGLPWAKAWGGYLREVRTLAGAAAAAAPDWSIGSGEDARHRARDDAAMRAMMGEHAGHWGMAVSTIAFPPAVLDRVVAKAGTLRLAAPVEVSPPTAEGASWQVQSQAEDRPSRDSAAIDARGKVVSTSRFADKPLIDRAVGWGVSIHLGERWGLANQLFNLAVVVGLVLMALSSVVLWWRRRPVGLLGAPSALAPLRHSWALVALVVVLAVLMPLFGTTLGIAMVAEALLLRWAPALARWMGWRTAPVAGGASPG